MARGAFVKSLIDIAEKAGLDMSDAARMSRAKDMGFDTSRTYQHGSSRDFEEFNKGKGGGIFFSDSGEMAEQFGEVKDFYLKKGNNPLSIKLGRITEDQKKLFDDMEESLWDENDIDSFGAEWEGLADAMEWGNLYKIAGRQEQNRVLNELRKRGFTSVSMPDFHGSGDEIAQIVFEPSQIRSINAAFDPAKKDSGNLLAGIATPAIGIGAMLSPDETYAAAARRPVSAMNLPQNNSTGSIQAPTNETAALFAALAGRYNEERKKRLHPIADMLMPLGELPEDLWTKRAYGDDVKMRDYINAGLGLL